HDGRIGVNSGQARSDPRAVPASDCSAARVHHPVAAAQHSLIIDAVRESETRAESLVVCIDDLTAMTADGVRCGITTEPQGSWYASGCRVWGVNVQKSKVVATFCVGQHDVVAQTK